MNDDNKAERKIEYKAQNVIKIEEKISTWNRNTMTWQTQRPEYDTERIFMILWRTQLLKSQ